MFTSRFSVKNKPGVIKNTSKIEFLFGAKISIGFGAYNSDLFSFSHPCHFVEI